MPQNHNNRNRRKVSTTGRGAPRSSHPPDAQLGNKAEREIPTIDTFGTINLPDARFPCPSGTPAQLSLRVDVPSLLCQQQRFSATFEEPQGLVARSLNKSSGVHATPTQAKVARHLPPAEQRREVHHRSRQGDFRPHALNSAATGKTSCSKAYEQVKLQTSPAQTPRTETSSENRELAGAKNIQSISALVEDPFAISAAKQRASQPTSPTLERVMLLRAEKEKTALAKQQEQDIADLTMDTSSKPSYHAMYHSNRTTERRRSIAAIISTEGDDLEVVEAANSDKGGLWEEASKSIVSVASSTASSFEDIEVPTMSETEHNGARRKWYEIMR